MFTITVRSSRCYLSSLRVFVSVIDGLRILLHIRFVFLLTYLISFLLIKTIYGSSVSSMELPTNHVVEQFSLEGQSAYHRHHIIIIIIIIIIIYTQKILK